jgi:hypothetical protein
MSSAAVPLMGFMTKSRAASAPSAFSPPRAKCSCGSSKSALTDKCDGCASRELGSEPVIGTVTRRVERNTAFARDLQRALGRRQEPTARAPAAQRFRHDFSRLSIGGGRAAAGSPALAVDEPSRLVAGISMAGEVVGAGDEDLVTAQTPLGPIAPPLGPVAPAAACNFSVKYANEQKGACASAGQCGAVIVFDIVDVTATGIGCPSLNGLMLTEVVTNDHGCSPANVQGGPGCPIDSHPPMLPTYGVLTNCTDTYGVCLGSVSQSKIPATGCTETVTQKIFVGGALAETHFIRFPITKTAGGCTGTVNRT